MTGSKMIGQSLPIHEGQVEKSCRQMMAKVQRAKQQGQKCTIHGFHPFLLAEAP